MRVIAVMVAVCVGGGAMCLSCEPPPLGPFSPKRLEPERRATARAKSQPINFNGALGFELPARRRERIVVARVWLAAGTALKTSLLRVVDRPSDLKWAGHLRPVDLVHFAGRRLRRDIPAGTPVTRGDLAEVAAVTRRPGLPVTRGGRSVTLRVDWVGGLGAWVRAGDLVDVGVVLRGRGRARLRMLSQAAKVLAAERWVTRGALRARRPWCSLLVLPREAQALALAQQAGRLVIFRRHPQDLRRAVYPPVTRRQLESRRFWQRLRGKRLRTLQHHGLPDDPGFGPGLSPK